MGLRDTALPSSSNTAGPYLDTDIIYGQLYSHSLNGDKLGKLLLKLGCRLANGLLVFVNAGGPTMPAPNGHSGSRLTKVVLKPAVEASHTGPGKFRAMSSKATKGPPSDAASGGGASGDPQALRNQLSAGEGTVTSFTLACWNRT